MQGTALGGLELARIEAVPVGVLIAERRSTLVGHEVLLGWERGKRKEERRKEVWRVE